MTENNSWLEYSKTILKKVSFDPKIFKKELLKSLPKLEKPEILKLQTWCNTAFSATLSVVAFRIIQDYLSQMI